MYRRGAAFERSQPIGAPRQGWQDPRLLKDKPWISPGAASLGKRDQGLDEPLGSLLSLPCQLTCRPHQSLTNWTEGWFPLPHPHPLDLPTGYCRGSLSWGQFQEHGCGWAGCWWRWAGTGGRERQEALNRWSQSPPGSLSSTWQVE